MRSGRIISPHPVGTHTPFRNGEFTLISEELVLILLFVHKNDFQRIGLNSVFHTQKIPKSRNSEGGW